MIHNLTRAEDRRFGEALPGCPKQTPDESTVSLATLRDLLREADRTGAPLGARLAIRVIPALGSQAAVLTWEGNPLSAAVQAHERGEPHGYAPIGGLPDAHCLVCGDASCGTDPTGSPDGS